MNKKDLIKNFKDYSPEQIAEAIKSDIVTSYELLHETGGAYTPLLKKKVNLALERMESSQNPDISSTEQSVDSDNEVVNTPSQPIEVTHILEIPSLEVPDLNTSSSSIQSDSAKEETKATDNSKSAMFSAPFSFKGRIRRTEYGISMIICFFISLGLNAIIGSANNSYSDPTGLIVLYFVLLIPYLWFVWAQGAKRCHDRGNSGWYQIIPFYGFLMLFAEGDANTNEYGNSPK